MRRILLLITAMGLLAAMLTIAAPGRSQPTKKGTNTPQEPLPPGAVLRLPVSAQLRHAYPIVSVAASPDGRVAASADERGAVCVWATTPPFLRFQLPEDTGYALAFSKDGILATVGSKLVLWNSETGKLVKEMDYQGFQRQQQPVRKDKKPEPCSITSLVFSPDGKGLFCGSQRQRLANNEPALGMWEVATAKLLRSFTGPKSGANVVALSPDGKTLASHGGGHGDVPPDAALCFWDVATGKMKMQILGQTDVIKSLTFDRRGKVIAAASQDRVCLWDAQNGMAFRDFANEGGGGIAFSPTANQLATGKPLALQGLSSGNIYRWLDNTAIYDSIAIAADGRVIVAGARNGRVRLWSLEKGSDLLQPVGGQKPITALAYSPDGSVLASASVEDDAVRLWSSPSGEQILNIDVGNPARRKNDLSTLDFSPDGKSLAAFSTTGIVFLWDLITGQSRKLPLEDALALAFSPDGKSLAVARRDAQIGRCLITLCDTATGKESKNLRPFDRNTREQTATAVAFSPDGKFLAVSNLGTDVTLWDIAAGKEARRIVGVSPWPKDLFFLEKGKYLAATSWDGVVWVYDTADGKQIRKVGTHDEGRVVTSPWPSFSFSAEGKRVAINNLKGHIFVYDSSSGKELRRLEARKGESKALAFAPDGKILASAGADGTILLWQVDP